MSDSETNPQTDEGQPSGGEQHAKQEREQPHGKDSSKIEREMRTANQKASMPKAFDDQPT